MRVLSGEAGVVAAFVLLIGAAVADDSAQLIGQWIDKLPNGASMVTVFTSTTVAFHGVDPQGNDGPTNTVQVAYKKSSSGAIAITAEDQQGDPLLVTVKDDNTLLMTFPGADPRTLVRQQPAVK